MVLLSPGVKTRELDYSVYAQELATTTVAMVGTARKGPIFEPTLVTTQRQFLEIFGEPLPTDYGAYAALQFLAHGSMMWYVRVADGSQKSAVVTVPAAVTAEALGTAADTKVFSFSLPYGNWDTTQLITITDGTITFTNGGSGTILSGGGEDNEATLDMEDGTVSFELLANNTNPWTISGKIKPIVLTARNSGVWGNQLKLVIKKDYLGRTVFDLSYGGDVVESWIDPVFDKTSSDYLETRINEESDYIEMDDLSTDDLDTSMFALGTYAFGGGTNGDKVMNVVDTVNDSFSGVVLGTANGTESFSFSLSKFPIDGSSTITATDGTLTLTNGEEKGLSLSDVVGTSTAVIDNEAGTITFTTAATNSRTWSLSGKYMDGAVFIIQGLRLFDNPETMDINLIMAPGRTEPEIINALISLCETRADCMCIIDPPMGLTPQTVADWHNGAGNFDDHQAFNSSYAALYWPWCEIYDPYTSSRKWLPPSGFIAGVYAENDKKGEAWFAPAGFNRGRITEPLRTEYSPAQGERDYLYSGGNAVNVIMNFTEDGITVWGQRTLQRKSSWLDRVNVRRLLLYLEKIIATSSRYFLFEQNDRTTWMLWRAMVEPVMRNVVNRRGIEPGGWRVIMDDQTVTTLHKLRGEMPGVIEVVPIGAAEKILIDFVLRRDATEFGTGGVVEE